MGSIPTASTISAVNTAQRRPLGRRFRLKPPLAAAPAIDSDTRVTVVGSRPGADPPPKTKRARMIRTFLARSLKVPATPAERACRRKHHGMTATAHRALQNCERYSAKPLQSSRRLATRARSSPAAPSSSPRSYSCALVSCARPHSPRSTWTRQSGASQPQG